jgi:hypothetical protein
VLRHRRNRKVSLSAAEHPGHLIYHTFPPHFAPFVPAAACFASSCLAFFLAKKENEAARSFIKNGWSIYRRNLSDFSYPHTYTSLRHQQTPTTVSSSPRSPTLHHSRCAPPPLPNPSFACSTPPACDLSASVPALSPSMKLKRFLRDLGITSPPGEHLPYWDPISYTRFLFDFR